MFKTVDIKNINGKYLDILIKLNTNISANIGTLF